jgi:hypothetical protein
MTAHERWHGTVNGYNYHDCRCNECRAAMSTFINDWRAENRQRPIPAYVEHGTVNAAVNYGCKCRPCREAKRDADRDYRARKRAAK